MNRMSFNNKEIIVILGPTAVGKTEYTINYARSIGSPIISCDSRQLYKGMVIGTAAPDKEEMRGVPHYFIGSHEIDDLFTAGRYEIEALEVIDSLFKEHDTLVVTGGSGLYIDALCHGLDDFPKTDQTIRRELTQRVVNEGIESLRRELKMVDPISFNAIDIANPQRIVRALEVFMMTGKPFSAFKTNSKKERPFHIKKVGLTRDRDELYNRINLRVDKMIEEGLVDEVRSLIRYREYPALKTVGYREIFDYLDGVYDLERAIELIKRNTRHYAKRQMTWWRRDEEIEWIELNSPTL